MSELSNYLDLMVAMATENGCQSRLKIWKIDSLGYFRKFNYENYMEDR